MDEENNSHEESGDYRRFGIPDVPRSTVTTAFGKTRTWNSLQRKEWVFLVVSLLNILAAIGITMYRLVKVAKDDPQNSDLTFTILIIVNAAFVAFYTFHGVLRERKYELYVQVVAILIILTYCIVEYSVNVSRRTDIKLVRLIIAVVFAPPNIILAVLVARDFGELEFRIAGASANLQKIYNEAAIFSCWLKFDLQVTVSLVVLVLRKGSDVELLEIVTLAVGIPYTLIWDIFGWFVLRLELKWGSWVFVLFGLAKPAYYIFKFVHFAMYSNDEFSAHDSITYCVIVCGALAMFVWLILMVEMYRVYRNFGQGLKERGKMNIFGYSFGGAANT